MRNTLAGVACGLLGFVGPLSADTYLVTLEKSVGFPLSTKLSKWDYHNIWPWPGQSIGTPDNNIGTFSERVGTLDMKSK